MVLTTGPGTNYPIKWYLVMMCGYNLHLC